MHECSCVPGAGAKCSSARAVIAASSTAGHGAARLPEANHCERRGAVISIRAAAGTVMPSASGAIGTGAAKGRGRESDASRFRFTPLWWCTGASSSSDARGEPVDVPQTGHRDALPLVRTPGQRVRAP